MQSNASYIKSLLCKGSSQQWTEDKDLSDKNIFLLYQYNSHGGVYFIVGDKEAQAHFYDLKLNLDNKSLNEYM